MGSVHGVCMSVDDADVDVSGRQSKRHTTVRRVTAGNYIPMLTELGQFRFQLLRV